MFQTGRQRGGIGHEKQALGIDVHAADCEPRLVLRVVALLKDRAIVAHPRKQRGPGVCGSCVDPHRRLANRVLRIHRPGRDREEGCDHI